MKPTRWWRVECGKDWDYIWAESSDEKEVRDSLLEAPEPRRLARLYEETNREWRVEE